MKATDVPNKAYRFPCDAYKHNIAPYLIEQSSSSEHRLMHAVRSWNKISTKGTNKRSMTVSLLGHDSWDLQKKI